MKIKFYAVAFVMVLATVVCVTAFAAEGDACPIHSFFGAIGGFLYNALPWNWHNWAGQ